MADIEIRINPRSVNKIYRPFFKNTSRYEIVYGGSGSGKSVAIAQRLIYRHLRDAGRNTLVVRKVSKTNRISTFPLLKHIISDWKLGDMFKINETDMRIKCPANGNEIAFSGIDDPEKLKSFTFENGNLTDVWVEESSEITEDDFQQLDLRLRGQSKVPYQITMSFNPISILSWIKPRFFDKTPDNTLILKTTYKDNEWLDDEYRTMLENLEAIDPTYYRIYALGEWGVLGNLILTNWEVKAIPKDPEFYASVSRGVDFGFKHPSAFLQAGFKDDELYIFDEIYKSEMTNNDLISAIKKKGITKEMTIIADCAEPARIEEMNRNGLRVIKSIKGPSSVRDGIEYLRRRKIWIHPDCTNTIGEIQGWKYREDKMGNVLDEPVPFRDDAMAALRYLVQLWRRKEDNFQKNNPLEWQGPFKEKVKYAEKRDYNIW